MLSSLGLLVLSLRMPIAANRRLTLAAVGTLALWLILEIGGRFLSPDWLHTLPETVAARPPGLLHPFKPNFSIRHDPWIGESALTGNIAPTETRAPVDFATDALGFRKTEGLPANGPLEFLLTGGASFAYGGGLSDPETFPSLLTQQEKLPTYNGGRFFWDSLHFSQVSRLIGRLPAKPKAVVFLNWENFTLDARQLDPLPWPTDQLGRSLLGSGHYDDARESFQHYKRYLTAFWSLSPVEVLSTRCYKKLHDGALFPNPYAEAVQEGRLPNGQRILYLRDEVQRVTDSPSAGFVRQQGDYFQEYASRLWRLHQTPLYIVLIPNRYTVYGPFTDGGRARPSNPYLPRLERELTTRGLTVFNCGPLLAAQAAADIQQREYSFYREDHHWSPLGVRRVAAAFAQFVREHPVPHAVQ